MKFDALNNNTLTMTFIACENINMLMSSYKLPKSKHMCNCIYL